MSNYPTENREYKSTFIPPVPILTMGVEIQPEWNEQFKKLSRMMNLTPKETINWIVDNWFKEKNQ